MDIGSPEGEPSALAKKVETLFASADIQAGLHSDMLHYLWVQYAITGGPWAALVQGGSFAMLNTSGAISNTDCFASSAHGGMCPFTRCLEIQREEMLQRQTG